MKYFGQKDHFIIAEIASSHDGKISKLKKLTDFSLNAGADAVWFRDGLATGDAGVVVAPGSTGCQRGLGDGLRIEDQSHREVPDVDLGRGCHRWTGTRR